MYHYTIVKGSSGSFLCPPGHPRHFWTLEGYESARKRDPFSIGPIDGALADDFDGSDAIKARVQKIFDEAELIPSEMWIRNVYGYFRTAYVPEPKPGEQPDRNVSNAVYHDPAAIAAGAARKALAEEYEANDSFRDDPNYRDGSKKPLRGARRGYEVTAKADGSEVFVYTLADDGSRYGALHVLEDHAETLTDSGFTDVHIEGPQTIGGTWVPERVRATNPVPIEPIDPNRHLAVLCVREYFPDHEPRLDLIVNPGKGYGSCPCTKCGETVQYEAKFDKLTKVTTRIIPGEGTKWTYQTECPEGGDHTID